MKKLIATLLIFLILCGNSFALVMGYSRTYGGDDTWTTIFATNWNGAGTTDITSQITPSPDSWTASTASNTTVVSDALSVANNGGNLDNLRKTFTSSGDDAFEVAVSHDEITGMGNTQNKNFLIIRSSVIEIGSFWLTTDASGVPNGIDGRVKDDSLVYINLTQAPLTWGVDTAKTLRVESKRSTSPGADDGFLKVYVGTVEVITLENMDNDEIVLTETRLINSSDWDSATLVTTYDDFKIETRD